MNFGILFYKALPGCQGYSLDHTIQPLFDLCSAHSDTYAETYFCSQSLGVFTYVTMVLDVIHLTLWAFVFICHGSCISKEAFMRNPQSETHLACVTDIRHS